MQFILAAIIIFLFCLAHLPALVSLRAYQATEPHYRAHHLWLGCFLYLIVFIIVSSIITGFLLLFLPTNFLFLFAIIPAALLFELPKNNISRTGFHLSHADSPITSTVTYLLSQCGEVYSLLLFLPLITSQDILFYPWILIAFFIIILVSPFSYTAKLLKTKLFFLLQFYGYLCIFVLFLFISLPHSYFYSMF